MSLQAVCCDLKSAFFQNSSAFAGWQFRPALPHSCTYDSKSAGGPQWMIWQTSTQSIPMPNAIVHITIRRGLSLVLKDATMDSCTDLRVTLVYISTRRNCGKLGAPTGCVNSFFSNERKKMVE